MSQVANNNSSSKIPVNNDRRTESPKKTLPGITFKGKPISPTTQKLGTYGFRALSISLFAAAFFLFFLATGPVLPLIAVGLVIAGVAATTAGFGTLAVATAFSHAKVSA